MFLKKMCLLVLVSVAMTASVQAKQQFAPSASQTSPTEAARRSSAGAGVLWGGFVLAQGRNADGQACIEILAQALDRATAKPQQGPGLDPLRGQHFVACGDGLSSSDYGVGRLAAVAGTLVGVQHRELARACGGDGLYAGTIQQSGGKGCVYPLPIVAVADSRSWPDMNRHGSGPALADFAN